PELARESEVYYGFQRDAVRDELPPLDTHSDEFGHEQGFGMGYGHAYYKTAVMRYNLQYVLGDERILEAMRNYVRQWSIKHPYPVDMLQSFISFTGVDLNWFFDLWIGTDKRIDYAIKGVKRRDRNDGQEVRLRRNGSMHMPLDLRITANDGKTYDYHIP